MMASASGVLGGLGIVGLLLILVGICLYMLPTIVGARRKVVNIGSVFAINLLLGWSLIGWAVALAMALRTNPPHAYDRTPVETGSGPMLPVPPGWHAVQGMPGWYSWWDGRQWGPPTPGTTPASLASTSLSDAGVALGVEADVADVGGHPSETDPGVTDGGSVSPAALPTEQGPVVAAPLKAAINTSELGVSDGAASALASPGKESSGPKESDSQDWLGSHQQRRTLGAIGAVVIAAALVAGGWAWGHGSASTTRIVHPSLYVANLGDWSGSHIPVRACPSSYGVGPSASSGPRGPAFVRTSIPARIASQLEFYSDASREVGPILGPNGWQCSVSIGADGNTYVTIYPPHVLKPASQNGTEETMGVSSTEIPACRGCVADLVCPIFVNAESQLENGSIYCPTFEPATESVRFLQGGPTLDFGVAIISDPPGDPGTNSLSGGDYPAYGALDYFGGGEEPGASSVSCVLPAAHAELCQTIVQHFVYEAERL
jgi:hypothetical protein